MIRGPRRACQRSMDSIEWLPKSERARFSDGFNMGVFCLHARLVGVRGIDGHSLLLPFPRLFENIKLIGTDGELRVIAELAGLNLS